MAKFSKKRGKAKPTISTASLPDIIFMLLFFFMVVTVLRDADQLVRVVAPTASELSKLEKKSLVNHLYVGVPEAKYQSVYGTSPRLQLGDKIARPEDIPLFIQNHRTGIPEKMHGQITSSIKGDRDVTMGIFQDVKTNLRKSGQLRVQYSARQGEVGEN